MSVEALKNRFVDLSSDAIAIGYLPRGHSLAHVVHVNPAFETLFGVQLDVLYGTCLDHTFGDTHWQDCVEDIASGSVPVRENYRAEMRVPKQNGEKLWVEVSMTVVSEGLDAGHYIYATYRDISHFKNVEMKARRAHNRLLTALDAYPDPIVIYDQDLNLVCWNSGYTQSITDDPDELVAGMHLRDVLAVALRNKKHPSAIGREDEWIEGLISSYIQGFEHEDIELTGDIHHRLLRSRAANGDYVVIRLNSTELVRQKRKAEEAHERLVAALNAYPAPFAIYDSDDFLVVWNEAYSDSMASEPCDIAAGMHRTDVARVAVKAGKIAAAVGNEEEWMSDEHQNAALALGVQDLELPGDVHHRLLRSRARNGDLVILRIDTTELVRQRRALEVSQERLISAINAYPDPFAIYDVDQNLMVWNPAYAASMTDHPEQLEQGVGLKTLLLNAAREGRIPAAAGRAQEWVDAYYSSDLLKPGIEDFEFSGDEHYRMVRSRADNGEHLVLRMNVTEVVRQRRAVEEYAKKLEVANREITHKALHDDLTGLGNRRFLGEKFEELLALRQSNGGEIAALHIDLDRFKQINDTMGHAAGDQVLAESSHRILQNVAREDVVARIGGDEFVVVLHVPAESERPETLAYTLLEDLSKPTFYEGKECRFGASIGLARTPLSGVDELLTNSDVALYKAKRGGRGQLGVFDRLDLEELRQNKTLADDILRALEAKEFEPFYQPQADAKTGEIVGIEALARWRHPKRGVLAPDAFLSIATDLNVVADIDKVVFEQAIDRCTHAFANHANPPSLSFNVSARRVSENNIEALRDRVTAYPGQVCFELLETIFLEEEDDEFLMQLDRLRELGISIEVDDFGSGRASVVALQRIGPDRLKIDRRLVTPVTQTSNGLRLLRSIVDIGQALEMGLTAEGVETPEQAEILAELGCDRLQGYLISKPISFDDLMVFLNLCQKNAEKAG